ncbi:MAG: hypothetical protein ACRD0I_01715 [Acidimicrobiales bacterium]
MLVVYVLRLNPAELEGGRVVGQVEDVASGGTTYIHSSQDLVRFLATARVSEQEGERP